MARRVKGCVLVIFLSLTAGAFGAPQANAGSERPVIISHVNVISMDAEGVLSDRTVVIEGGKIRSIDANAIEPPAIKLPKNAIQVDGHGKFLMPCLADLHVHLFSPDDMDAYTLYGVCTVLNMDGGPQHLRWRQQVRDGELLGPTIDTAGHIIDGLPPLNELFLTAETPADAEAIVRSEEQAGYDAIKLYGTLRPDVFRAVVQTADAEKIPVIGHVNRQVGALAVLKSSQVLAAHLEDLLFARFDHMPSDAELQEFATAIAASHITVTPNLNVNPASIAQLQDLDGVLHSPESALLSPAAYSQWMPANNRNERNEQTAQQIEMMQGSQQMLLKMVKMLSDRGVPLVLGTDAAPYGLPGLSVHQELQELAEAGVSPYQALRTATSNAGKFITTSIPGAPSFGTIREGSEADLLLLSANPLEDVRNTQRIECVMMRGRWLSAADLARLRGNLDSRAKQLRPQLDAIDAALATGDTAPARKFAAAYPPDRPWYSEWVLRTKARKLQSDNLPAAIQIARLDVDLFPDSFSAPALLADLLFQHGEAGAASAELKKSLALEPHNSASLNLRQRIESAQLPLRYAPAGTYEIEYVNDQSQQTQKTELHIEKAPDGHLRGSKVDTGSPPAPLASVLAGDNRLWAVANTPYGQLEFRVIVTENNLTGYWAGPFGQNGKISGKKTEPKTD
jgi:imidazolonepropionase-like amidohydrolase